MIRKPMSEKTKKKISEAHKNRVIKGVAKGIFTKGHKHLTDMKNKLSDIHKKRVADGIAKGLFVNGHKYHDGWKGCKHSNDTKKLMSEKQKEIRKNPDILKKMSEVALGHPCNHRPKFRYKDILMRSSWEVIVAEKLDELNFKWEYEPKRFYFEGKNFTYVPDFYLPEEDLYIEVKGFWRIATKDKEKVELFSKNNNLLLIQKEEMKNLDKIFVCV